MGHVILTSHLLPLIKETASKGNTVRIVNQASNAHQGAPSDVKFASLDELNQDLGPNGQYGRSKLAGILYAKYINKVGRACQPQCGTRTDCTHTLHSTSRLSSQTSSPMQLTQASSARGSPKSERDQRCRLIIGTDELKSLPTLVWHSL